MNRFTLIALVVIGAAILSGFLGCKDKAEETNSGTSTSPSTESPSNAKLGTAKTDSPTTTKSVDSQNNGKPISVDKPTAKIAPANRENQPDMVTFRYCIIGEAGSANPIGSDRTAAQAATMAAMIEQSFRRGDGRNTIIQEMHDKKFGGIGLGEMTLLNYGVNGADPKKMIYPRDIRPIIGPIVFNLDVGQMTTVPFSPLHEKSLGTWVLQRLK